MSSELVELSCSPVVSPISWDTSGMPGPGILLLLVEGESESSVFTFAPSVLTLGTFKLSGLIIAAAVVGRII